MADETKPTRKGSPPIKVYCLPDERRAIEEKAAAAGMSLSAYLLAVGQGYKITGVVDYEHVRELARINGDLGQQKAHYVNHHPNQVFWGRGAVKH
nr:conjugal transfer relaxosome component [Shuttle vector pKV12]AWI97856.1 TraJ [Shuttle vector pBACOV]AWI97859.1 TraJ [Shuttle vector pBACOV-sfGFP]AXF54472.1 TraJ [Shuttle vector pBACOV-SPLipB-cel8A]AXF54477.1 TraJ [Shuttle vector pPgrac-cel8A]AXF54483.1 TraJ [Shuttle vector pPxylA-cel8A]AXF54489.1 TraJ [Shuttle vector pPxylA+-cel8A]AXF54495.1 TraJ [Shuttle vector pP43-cel8A]AXF54500.1 TraJ [Shuttle vector pPtrnQ-cel8A]AXF54505.1 TraJ [Shuttle vector pPylb-cel8A]AXF54510.1 TraJ [Shuttle 